MKRFAHGAAAVLWPSFMMAGVLEILVFALVDPGALTGFDGEPLDLSATTVYSLGFFVFWAVIATAGALTQLLQLDTGDINPP
jgi:hypothetical protein